MSTTDIRRVKASEIELKDRLVAVQRVAKVTKGGRTFSFSAIVVVGDEQGIVGYGLGKAKEVSEAIAKGIEGFFHEATVNIDQIVSRCREQLPRRQKIEVRMQTHRTTPTVSR